MSETERKIQEIEFKNLLTGLGFDVNLRGYVFFEELVFDVCELLKDGKEVKDIEKIIPVLITEYGSCFHEIGRNNYLKRIDEFFAKRRNIESDENIDKEIQVIIPNISLNSRIIGFSKYLNERRIISEDDIQIKEDTSKVNVKKKK